MIKSADALRTGEAVAMLADDPLLFQAQLASTTARMISHRGSPMGGTVSLLTFPDLGLAIAAANVTHAVGVDTVALQVAETFTRHRNRQ
jgi:hypothetical protein